MVCKNEKTCKKLQTGTSAAAATAATETAVTTVLGWLRPHGDGSGRLLDRSEGRRLLRNRRRDDDILLLARFALDLHGTWTELESCHDVLVAHAHA